MTERLGRLLLVLPAQILRGFTKMSGGMDGPLNVAMVRPPASRFACANLANVFENDRRGGWQLNVAMVRPPASRFACVKTCECFRR